MMKIRCIHPLVSLGESSVTLEGGTIKYNLKQSQRIRGIRLEIRAETGLTVVVPRKYTMQQVEDLLKEKSRWIQRHLQPSVPVQMALFRKEAGHGDRLPYMGGNLQLFIRQNGQRPGTAVMEGGSLYINPGTGSSRIPRLLEKWYRAQALEVFIAKADAFKEKMGVKYKAILIRGQKTRWGSCAPSGNLTLNWKLLFAPERIIDYVIIHELAHLRHMNHSRQFWSMVESYCPRWREYRKWLSHHEEEMKAMSGFNT
jgi:predicted metal-dependent hydrolase